MKVKYSYGVAAESSSSSPCSNVPVACPLCSNSSPAVWKYFMKAHFQETHKSAPIPKYEHLWKLSNFEVAEMKKIWAKRKNVVVKRTKKSDIPPLVVSEHHRAHIPARYRVSLFTLEGVNDFLPLFYHSHAQSSTHESNEECASEGILSDVPQDDESSNEEDVDEEEQREILEPTFEESPILNTGGFSPTSED